MKIVVADAGMRVVLDDLQTAGRCMVGPAVDAVVSDASKVDLGSSEVDLGSPEDIHMGLHHMQKVDMLSQI